MRQRARRQILRFPTIVEGIEARLPSCASTAQIEGAGAGCDADSRDCSEAALQELSHHISIAVEPLSWISGAVRFVSVVCIPLTSKLRDRIRKRLSPNQRLFDFLWRWAIGSLKDTADILLPLTRDIPGWRRHIRSNPLCVQVSRLIAWSLAAMASWVIVRSVFLVGLATHPRRIFGLMQRHSNIGNKGIPGHGVRHDRNLIRHCHLTKSGTNLRRATRASTVRPLDRATEQAERNSSHSEESSSWVSFTC